MNDNKNGLVPTNDEAEFYRQVADLLVAARQHAKRQLDSTIALTYYEIGRMIVEREQQGQKRAQYGVKLIKGLSEYLTEQIGKGFSVVNLKNIRKFYQTYSPQIGQTMTAQSEKSQTLFSFSDNALLSKGQTASAQFLLSWSHYQILMRVENGEARQFYEIEAKSLQWSVRELARQVGSSLYERLALSRDKDKVMELAKAGQLVERPRDIFKTPYVLEFTGLEERAEYSLYLPDKALLQQKLAEWVEEFEEAHGGSADETEI
jgi:hypothetical protein